MTSTTFVDTVTPIVASWLNDVNTTVYGKIINVKLAPYYAVGNGVVDDTTSITNAITAANAAGGGIVYFPTGTYKCSNTVQLAPFTGVTLLGDGRYASVISFSVANAAGFYLWGNGSGIKSMGFTASIAQTSGGYVQLAGTSNYINDVNFDKDFLGLNVTGATSQISNLSFTNGSSGGKRIVFNCGDSSPTMSNIVMLAQSAPYPLIGIDLQHVTALTMTDIDIIQQGVGLNMTPGTGHSVLNIQVSNGFFDSCSTNININPTSTGNVGRINFINSWAGDATNNGIVVNNSGTGIVKGITFVNQEACLCGLSGLTTAGVCTDINLIGGSFNQNVDGLFFNHTGNVKVVGAEAGAYQGFTGNTDTGITFGTNCTNIICTGCSTIGNTTAGITDNTSNSVIKFINDNIVPSYAKVGSITVTASPFSYVATYDKTIYITGGTVSSIAVGGTTLFTATEKTVHLRQGETVIVTYSGLPTMNYTA